MFKVLKDRLMSVEYISERVADIFTFVPSETPFPYIKVTICDEESLMPPTFKGKVLINLTIRSRYKGEAEIRTLCTETIRSLEQSDLLLEDHKETVSLKLQKITHQEEKDGVTRTAELFFEGLKIRT